VEFDSCGSFGRSSAAAEGSLENFITSTYLGLPRRYEYEVQHPPWMVRRARWACFEGDTAFYGPEFASILEREPDSAVLAEGSAITVMRPENLP